MRLEIGGTFLVAGSEGCGSLKSPLPGDPKGCGALLQLKGLVNGFCCTGPAGQVGRALG